MNRASNPASILRGDALELIAGWERELDLVVTDPPYAFSGSGAEHAISATVAVVLRETALRLKTGGWMVVFAASSWRSTAYMDQGLNVWLEVGVSQCDRPSTGQEPRARCVRPPRPHHRRAAGKRPASRASARGCGLGRAPVRCSRWRLRGPVRRLRRSRSCRRACGYASPWVREGGSVRDDSFVSRVPPSVTFVAKAQIEVPLPEGIRTMHLGFKETNRVRFTVEYDADRAEEADAVLRDALASVGKLLLEESINPR